MSYLPNRKSRDFLQSHTLSHRHSVGKQKECFLMTSLFVRFLDHISWIITNVYKGPVFFQPLGNSRGEEDIWLRLSTTTLWYQCQEEILETLSKGTLIFSTRRASVLFTFWFSLCLFWAYPWGLFHLLPSGLPIASFRWHSKWLLANKGKGVFS